MITIHPTAIIDDGAKIGENTRIWHWCHVCGGARIGDACSFGQNVFIGNDVLIGNNVKVQNNVSIYDAVTLEDDVFCGPSMVFTNVYNPRSAVTRKNEYRKTLIKRGATLGANCTIVCGVTIGEYAFIGAGAVVNKDVKPYAVMAGVPAKQIGWMSESGEKLSLPLRGDAETQCPVTAAGYTLAGGVLKKTSPTPSDQTNPSDALAGGETRTGGVQARIDTILGPHKELLGKGKLFTSKDYDQMRMDHLEAKYLGRA